MIKSVLTVIVLTGVIGISALFYLLPLLIGWVRRVSDLGAIAAINILLGWTFVGWVLALAMALRSVRAASPMVQVVQNLPPVPPHFPYERGVGWAGPPGPPPPRPDSPPPLMLPPAPRPAEGSGDEPHLEEQPVVMPEAGMESPAHGS